MTRLLTEFPKFKLIECNSFYFDNAKAFLWIKADIEDPDTLISEPFDRWTTALSRQISEKLRPQEDQLKDVLRQLNTEVHDLCFLSEDQFMVFPKPCKNSQPVNSMALAEQHDRVLWVTRVLCIDGLPKNLTGYETWLHRTVEEQPIFNGGEYLLHPGEGNNLVVGFLNYENEHSLMRGLLVAMYFYTVFDSLNQNLRKLFLNLSGKGDQLTTRAIFGISKTRSHIEFLETDLSDALIGLQGKRKKIADLFLMIWGYRTLKEAVDRKSKLIKDFVDQIHQKKQRKYAKVVEAMLAAIGGVTLLEFVLSLFSFTPNTRALRDSIPGLTDATQYISIDSALYIMIAILLVIWFTVLKGK